MFERFTERARQVVVLARDEALTLSHDRIGSEHLLLGVIGERRGLGARALESLGVNLEEARAAVARTAPPTGTKPGQMPFTPQARWVLERALRDMLALGHEAIDTEHILLGLTEEPDGAASRILAGFELDCDAVRMQVFALTGQDAVTRPTIPVELSDELRELRLAKEEAQAAGDDERARELAARQAQLIDAAQAIWSPADEPALSGLGRTRFAPPPSAAVLEELERLRRQTADAAAAGELGKAARLRDQVWRLEAKYRLPPRESPDPDSEPEGENRWNLTGGMIPLQPTASEELPAGASFDPFARRSRFALRAVPVGSALGAATLVLGILIGWAIWG